MVLDQVKNVAVASAYIVALVISILSSLVAFSVLSYLQSELKEKVTQANEGKVEAVEVEKAAVKALKVKEVILKITKVSEAIKTKTPVVKVAETAVKIVLAIARKGLEVVEKLAGELEAAGAVTQSGPKVPPKPLIKEKQD